MRIDIRRKTRAAVRLTDFDAETLQTNDQDIGGGHALHRYGRMLLPATAIKTTL